MRHVFESSACTTYCLFPGIWQPFEMNGLPKTEHSKMCGSTSTQACVLQCEWALRPLSHLCISGICRNACFCVLSRNVCKMHITFVVSLIVYNTLNVGNKFEFCQNLQKINAKIHVIKSPEYTIK